MFAFFFTYVAVPPPRWTYIWWVAELQKYLIIMISCHCCCCCRFSIHKRATITTAATSTTRADTPKQVKDGGGRCVQLIKYTKKCVESGGGRKIRKKKLVHALIYPYWIIEAASKPANKQVSEHTRVWGLDIFFRLFLNGFSTCSSSAGISPNSPHTTIITFLLWGAQEWLNGSEGRKKTEEDEAAAVKCVWTERKV